MKHILVLGSLNIDLVQQVPRIPVPGETLQGSDLQFFAGGKGANQACAASLLGGHVRMAGKVGSDPFAARLTSELQRCGVATHLIGTSPAPTGSAIICVLPNGENTIIISAGANADITPDFALQAVSDLQPGDLLLCQLEVPLETVQTALTAAYRKQVITILDPAPACPLSNELLSCVTILTPNQTEAALLLGNSPTIENYSQATVAAQHLQARGVTTVIIKMGAAGCLIAGPEFVIHTPGFTVDAVDTTAAGDTFNGGLAAALARGSSLAHAAEFANAAAALSVTKPGAIASIPTHAQVTEFLASQKPRH